MATELCPKCGRGRKIEHVYELNGVTRDDSYCNYCGKNWPKPAKEPAKA